MYYITLNITNFLKWTDWTISYFKVLPIMMKDCFRNSTTIDFTIVFKAINQTIRDKISDADLGNLAGIIKLSLF